MLIVSNRITERLPTDPGAKKAALDKSSNLATKSLAGVQQIFSQPKPASLTDAQWNQEKSNLESQIHSTLGYVALNRLEYPKAIEEYDIAIKSAPKDAVSHFRLGLAYEYQAADASKALVEAIDAENKAKTAKAEQSLLDELVAKRQAMEEDARTKRDKAIDELVSAVAIGGVVAQPARTELEKLYKVKNNDSLEGLDQLIAQKKTQLG